MKCVNWNMNEQKSFESEPRRLLLHGSRSPLQWRKVMNYMLEGQREKLRLHGIPHLKSFSLSSLVSTSWFAQKACWYLQIGIPDEKGSSNDGVGGMGSARTGKGAMF